MPRTLTIRILHRVFLGIMPKIGIFTKSVKNVWRPLRVSQTPHLENSRNNLGENSAHDSEEILGRTLGKSKEGMYDYANILASNFSTRLCENSEEICVGILSRILRGFLEWFMKNNNQKHSASILSKFLLEIKKWILRESCPKFCANPKQDYVRGLSSIFRTI